MKKAVSLILIILLFATTAFAVVACSSKEEEETMDYFTVVSYNTRCWDLKDWDGVTHEERIASIKAQIASVNPDIVGLQEIDKNHGRSKNLDYAKYFSPENYYDYYAEALRIGDYLYGITTLSKTEAISVEQYNLPNPVKEELIEKADFVDKILLTVSIENRVVQRTVINVLGTQIAFYNTHTSFESPEMRVAQIEYIYSLMEADKAPYKVLVGDFNTGDGVEELSVFFAKYNLCISDNSIVTFPPDSTIDNIIFSRNLSANNFQVFKTPHSDHFMLSADFKIIG